MFVCENRSKNQILQKSDYISTRRPRKLDKLTERKSSFDMMFDDLLKHAEKEETKETLQTLEQIELCYHKPTRDVAKLRADSRKLAIVAKSMFETFDMSVVETAAKVIVHLLGLKYGSISVIECNSVIFSQFLGRMFCKKQCQIVVDVIMRIAVIQNNFKCKIGCLTDTEMGHIFNNALLWPLDYHIQKSVLKIIDAVYENISFRMKEIKMVENYVFIFTFITTYIYSDAN